MNEAAPWDAIVIGSGLGGLAAAAALANKGQRVLVVERLDHFGGAASALARNYPGMLTESDPPAQRGRGR